MSRCRRSGRDRWRAATSICSSTPRSRRSVTAATLESKLPNVAGVLEAAEDDILAFYGFPADHRRKIRSTNPLERFNREIGRRTDVVGIFPDDRSLIRLASMLAIEQNDEWLVGRAYMAKHTMDQLAAPQTENNEREEIKELQAA